MAFAFLDVLIDPRKAREGAREVQRSLTSMGQSARTVTTQMQDRFDRLRSSLFSVRNAMLGLGLGLVARDTIQVAIQLERAERGLRAVTTSAQAAREQLERIRQIGDKFQLFQDADLANSFRLLAANGIKDVEGALDTIANAAAQTGVDVETATTAVIAAQERQLRQLGVQLIDLGTGKALIAFGKIRLEVNKTDQELRRGLIQVLRQGFPDATKVMGDQLEFQINRAKDVWDDLQVAIMQGGLKDYLVATFKTFADGFNPEGIKSTGKEIAEGTIKTLETIAKGAAFVYDTFRPLSIILFDTIRNALSAFSKLPPEIQATGILGYLFLGTQGRVAIVGALALANALGVKVEEVGKAISQAGAGMVDMAANSPLGMLLKKGTEMATGKELPSRPPHSLQATGEAPMLADLFKGVEPEALKAGVATDDFFKRLRANLNQIEEQNKKIKQQATGKGLVQGDTVDENAERVRAQMAMIRDNLKEQIKLEEQKRDVGFSPERAEAEKAALEAIQGLERNSLTLTEQQKETIKGYFAEFGKAQAATAAWNAELQVSQGKTDRLRKILEDTANAERDLADQAQALGQPIGAARREEELRLKLIRTMERERIDGILPQEFQWLQKIIGLIAKKEQQVGSTLLKEQQSLQIQEEIARLRDETRDMTGGIAGQVIGSLPGARGTQTPSRETLLNQMERDASRQGLTFDRDALGKEIDQKLEEQKKNTLTRTTFEMERQVQTNKILTAGMGKSLDTREAEIRALQAQQELQQKGIRLTEGEIQAIEKQSKAVQDSIVNLRNTEAINSFVDSFRVGWDTIIRSGEQAFSHLEDALTKWITTGKLDFASFSQFVTQELIRMGIRASLSKLIETGIGAFGGGGGAGGLLSSFGDFVGGFFSGGKNGPGLGTGSGDLQAVGFDQAQRGGMFDAYGRIPGFQRGGVNHNERIIRISEGQTPEAIIPLQGGRVPVKMMGGAGVTVNAPITIITPDAQGARKSAAQIQTELSTALSRAAKRNG